MRFWEDRVPGAPRHLCRAEWGVMIADHEHDVRAFARLLRQLRVDAGLTQEELATAARVGARSVSDLERGVSRTVGPPHGGPMIRLGETRSPRSGKLASATRDRDAGQRARHVVM